MNENSDRPTVTIAGIGSALYGAQWQTELARTLGVTDRTVRRWAAGKGVPRDIELVLAQLAKARAKQLRAWARHLEVARLPNKKGNGILGGAFGPRGSEGRYSVGGLRMRAKRCKRPPACSV